MLAPLLKDIKETAPHDVVRHEVIMTCRRAAFISQADQGDDLRYSRLRFVSWGIALVACLLVWWAVVKETLALIAMIG